MMGVGLLINIDEQGTSQVLRWFRLRASAAGAWVPSLTEDPGSHKLHSMAKKKKTVTKRYSKMEETPQNHSYWELETYR